MTPNNVSFGGPCGDRTHDLQIANLALSRVASLHTPKNALLLIRLYSRIFFCQFVFCKLFTPRAFHIFVFFFELRYNVGKGGEML